MPQALPPTPNLTNPSTPSPKPRFAWVTFLLTSPSYLPGVLLLSHTLSKHSRYPLIVAVNPSLPAACVDAMRGLGLEVRVVRDDGLVPKMVGGGERREIVDRFKDVWCKLGVWGFEEFERVALVDADMIVRKDVDDLFGMDLGKDSIAACHACVCNLDDSAWAPTTWRRQNCAYTPQIHPLALTTPKPASASHPTHCLLNAGLILLHPSVPLLSSFKEFLSTPSPVIDAWMFPEQDFLAHWYRGKWTALSWRYNGLKTMRYWHGSFWRDEEVGIVHYIIDKPWQRRPRRLSDSSSEKIKQPMLSDRQRTNPYRLESPSIIAKGELPNLDTKYHVDHHGTYEHVLECELGKPGEWADAVTHGWWWDGWEEMISRMRTREEQLENSGPIEAAESLKRGRSYAEGLVAS